jgi:methylamine dehydrogenase accessory protein MauD
VALLIARLLLSGVLAVAGVAKLADRRGSREAAAAFGVSAGLAGPVALLLPFAELAAAAALLPAASAPWGALGALALLAAFSAAIARAIARAEEHDCHCFGRLHAGSAGRGALARNVGLGLLAGFVAVAGWSGAGPDALGWLADLAPRERAIVIGLLALGAAVTAIGWLCWLLLRQNGRLLLRLDAVEGEPGGQAARSASVAETDRPPEGLPVGTAAPAFAAHDLDGEPVALDSLLARGLPVALFFTDPACGACDPLLPLVARVQAEHADELTLVVLSHGSVARTRAKRDEHELGSVLVHADLALPITYRAYGMPSALLIDAEGRIGSRVAMGAEAVERLLDEQLIAAAGATGAAPDGAAAPDQVVAGVAER